MYVHPLLAAFVMARTSNCSSWATGNLQLGTSNWQPLGSGSRSPCTAPFQNQHLSVGPHVQGSISDSDPRHPRSVAQVPVLEVDGEAISQSNAHLVYAGKLSGLYPQDPLAAMRVDECLLVVDDVIAAIRPSLAEKDDDKKAAMRKTLAEETLPKWFGLMEANLQNRGHSHAAGNCFTVADLAFYNLFMWMKKGALDGVPTNILDPYTKLCAIVEAVASHPKVKEWNAKH